MVRCKINKKQSSKLIYKYIIWLYFLLYKTKYLQICSPYPNKKFLPLSYKTHLNLLKTCLRIRNGKNNMKINIGLKNFGSISLSTYVYTKSTKVSFPSSKLGLRPTHNSRKRVSPPRNQRGGHTRLCVRGWGVPIRTTGKKPSTLSSLCSIYREFLKHSCFKQSLS